MAIDPLGPADKTAVAGDPARKLYQNMVKEQDTRQGDPATQNNISVSLQRASSTMGKLGAFNEEKNLLARNIRETEHALRGVAANIDKMKVHLEKIVKNWPPFSADSAERKQILMSYVSLRKEIEKMTFPPPALPLYEKNKTVWDELGHENIVNSIPQVSESTTDKQVRSALSGLDELSSVVAAGRTELANAAS
jgi:hypothetical protein